MERNFTNENMEEFLRRNADGLRMRPSARVWKTISGRLNRRRRIIGLILGTSLLLTTALGYYLINESANRFHNSAANSAKKENSIHGQSSSAVITDKKLTAIMNEAVKSKNLTSIRNLIGSDEVTMPESMMNFNSEFSQNFESAQNTFTPTIVDSYFEGGWEKPDQSATTEGVSIVDPLSIESVLNLYRPRVKKLGWQAYFTPTVSYRKLNDNYIDNVATHKPAFGFELGVAAKYAVSKKAKLRAGLQFNVNRYEIKTYDSYTQLATIRLNDRNGVDYVRTITNYNNFSGYKSNWLQNFYLQLSAPVGMELKLKGDDKVQFGIASTLQPTYLFRDRAYLISTDYKNYTEMPNLVRRWNVNTNLETFVAYSTGHLNWQVGPQVRYQILSSYLKKYPVKENLFDFGLKVGISFNKQ
jgi:hypothetical protein